ncbi:ABC transporter ATP-binding protein [Anaerosalibacter massiliensis]|uniref:ABC transporter ATP-binding protein n=1 Tax=Anaerosalibacter massiliensis TaxID=1347392 RepID=A0A9X2MGK5_9FIRM|nr:ABC transporter ATP-binding protein [Anaerosalibacter massiliensis]MCR2043133.1 ABC transporter ATP-binding protein [Anaerosalibacter massiliensis]
MDYALEVEKLNFAYEEELTLKDISFNIKKGEFISIIGPNGSGKSTLLKNISNIYSPQSGSIKIYNNDIKKYGTRELAKNIALVPQDTIISYNFSVLDIVLMGRFSHLNRFEKEREEDFKIVYEALKKTNTFHLKDRNIDEISGGERQRVIIARALAQEPKIIFLDEPTSHLDINHQMELLNLLKILNKERKTTIILVIHDINLACRYSDKIILMNNGEIVSIGTPKEVVTRKNIEKTYGLNIIVEENPYTDSIYIVPLSLNNYIDQNKKKSRIHVIAGGGTGGEILSKLEEKGYNISIGVINIGDSDWQLGRKLSLNIIDEKPFSEISDKAFKENMKAIEKSHVVILSSIPYGRGNLKNLEAAYNAIKMGKTVYLVDSYSEYDKFDYIEGKGIEILEKMKRSGLRIINSIDEFLEEGQ